MVAQVAHRRHHPAHAQPRADLFRLTRACRARADDLLQRDDVRVHFAQHVDDAGLASPGGPFPGSGECCRWRSGGRRRLRVLGFGHDARLETTDALAFRRAPVLRRSRREALAVCASPRRLDHMRLSYPDDGRHAATDAARVGRSLLGVLPARARAHPARPPIALREGTVIVQNQTKQEWRNVVVTVNDHFRAGAASLAPGGRFLAPLNQFQTAFGQHFDRGSAERREDRADGDGRRREAGVPDVGRRARSRTPDSESVDQGSGKTRDLGRPVCSGKH